MSRSPGMFAVLVGGASIICTGIGYPGVALGLAGISLLVMFVATVGGGTRAGYHHSYKPQPRPSQRCRCGRCESCDPLAQTWGRG